MLGSGLAVSLLLVTTGCLGDSSSRQGDAVAYADVAESLCDALGAQGVLVGIDPDLRSTVEASSSASPDGSAVVCTIEVDTGEPRTSWRLGPNPVVTVEVRTYADGDPGVNYELRTATPYAVEQDQLGATVTSDPIRGWWEEGTRSQAVWETDDRPASPPGAPDVLGSLELDQIVIEGNVFVDVNVQDRLFDAVLSPERVERAAAIASALVAALPDHLTAD